MESLATLLGENGITIQADAKQIISDYPQLKAINDELFKVVSLPNTIDPQLKELGLVAPDGATLYRADVVNTLGEFKTYDIVHPNALGKVSNTYDILHPDTFFNTILESLARINYTFDVSKIEYLPTRGGSAISFKVPLTNIVIPNAKEVGDITEIYALFTTTFDGTGATSMSLYSKRVACANMQLFRTQKDTFFRFRHTPRQNERALAYTDAILKSSSQIQRYEEMFNALAKIEIRTQKQIDDYMSKIVGFDVTAEKLHVKRKNLVESIEDAWDIERARTGNNAYGFLNAVTYYTNHTPDENGQKRGEDYLIFGTGADLNLRAEKAMVELVS